MSHGVTMSRPHVRRACKQMLECCRTVDAAVLCCGNRSFDKCTALLQSVY